jgi:hypothetical protein
MADILETLSEALDAFELRCMEIQADMQKAEAVGERLGLGVPWASGKPKRGPRVYAVRHDDARDVVLAAVQALGSRPFSRGDIAKRVNARMVAESRPTFTTAAVERQLAKAVIRGELKRCDDHTGMRWQTRNLRKADHA